jgi:hypothetical protein
MSGNAQMCDTRINVDEFRVHALLAMVGMSAPDMVNALLLLIFHSEGQQMDVKGFLHGLDIYIEEGKPV